MSTATFTSKGRITVPVAVRKALRLGTGDRLEFVEISSRQYELNAAT